MEYDNAQDTIEALKKDVSTLTKDLKVTIEKATESKENLIKTISELSLEQSKNASILANSSELNEQLVNLQVSYMREFWPQEGACEIPVPKRSDRGDALASHLKKPLNFDNSNT